MSGSYNDPASVLAVAQGLLGQGDAQKAYVKAKRALGLFQKESDFDGAGRALITLVGSYLAAEKFQDAMKAAEGMLAEFKKAGQRKLEVTATTCMAEVHFAMGKPEIALKVAREAIELAQELRERQAEVLALRTCVKVSLSLGDMDEALQSSFRAADLCRECKDVDGEAVELLAAAEILLSRAEWEDALSTAKKAAKLFKSVGNTQGQANALEIGATAASAAGVMKQASWGDGDAGSGAIDMSAASLKLYKLIGDGAGQISAGLMLANLQLQVGDYGHAEQTAGETAAVAGQLGLQAKKGDAHITCSDALIHKMTARQKDLSDATIAELITKAVEHAGQAVVLVPQFVNGSIQVMRGRALRQLAHATHVQKEVIKVTDPNTQAYIKEAVGIFQTWKEKELEAKAQLLLADIAFKAKDINEAADAVERAMQLYQELVDREGQVQAGDILFQLRTSPLWNKRVQKPALATGGAATDETKESKFLPGIAPGAQGLKNIKGGSVYIHLDNLKGRAAKNIGGKKK